LLSKKVIENVLYAAISTGGDFAEIFVEDRYNTNIKMVGGYIENSISGRDYGVGIRVFDELNSAYGYTNDSSEENLIKVAKEVALAARSKKDNFVLNMMKSIVPNKHYIKTLPNTVDKKKKVELLKDMKVPKLMTHLFHRLLQIILMRNKMYL